jgi:NADPH:quinone reductase-like Zn-dependent oxidoreductase
VRKIVIHKPGGYERLTIEEHPDLPPGPGEVLIEVAAIGVNYADCVTRMGLYASAKHYIGYPITPGFEVAGKVLSTGSAFSLTTDNHSVLGFNLSFLFGKSALMEQGLQQLVQWLKARCNE